MQNRLCPRGPRVPVVSSSFVAVLALAGVVGLGVSTGCTPVEFEDTWMDAEGTEDPALSDASYLVSTKIVNPTEEDLATPVVIAVHGFGASTFEWIDFKDYGESRGLLVSAVLLGGHGRNLDVWSTTTWSDWAQPVLEEYVALRSLGYKNIVFATSSTGGTLLTQLFHLDAFQAFGPPQGVVMVAPLLVPSNKLLYQARWIGWVLNNAPSGINDDEKVLFYYNRPHVVFYPLLDLIEKTATDLAVGIDLPEGMPLHIFQADGDTAVDVASLKQWRTGLLPASQVDITEFESDLHVLTREVARDTWSEEDERLQMIIFDRIEEMARANEAGAN